jgi:ADP-heptose:LPS heptosyltransferase
MEKIAKENIKKILVIRWNNIGDMICAIPILMTIRKEFPETVITVLADINNLGIIDGASYVDNIIVFRKGSGIFRYKHFAYWKLFRQNKINFDLALAIKKGFSSTLAIITFLSWAKLRVGCTPEKEKISL